MYVYFYFQKLIINIIIKKHKYYFVNYCIKLLILILKINLR